MLVTMVQYITMPIPYCLFNGNDKPVIIRYFRFCTGQISIHVMMLIVTAQFYFNIHVVTHFEMEHRQSIYNIFDLR